MAIVLVVDDTAVDRRLAGGLLEKSPDLTVRYAENGNQALELMQQSVPDLVVTDLQMPEMDGLEVVTKVRMIYPKVPVILMTAKGSEQIALEALAQGASSYVPKSLLSEQLLNTVEELLVLSRADQTYSRLMACQDRLEFSYSLDNDPELADALIDLIQQVVEGMQFTDHTGKFRLGVAVREALMNAMFRGNLEITSEEIEESREALLQGQPADLVQQRQSKPPYCERKVHVEASINRDDQARFVIRDEGPGFSFAAAANAEDLSTTDSLHSRRGRGLVLMRSFMDSVTYNAKGNEVTLIKQRDRPR